MGCFQNHWKNKPQTNSVGAAALLFIAGGMNIAWSVGFNNYTLIIATTHVRIAWFIGAIIGAVLGAALSNIIKSRKYLYLASACLLLIDGIICVAASRDRSAITAAHYIDGIAVGMIFVPAMVLIGEESISYMRGFTAASIELMCFYLGAFLQIIFTQTWSYTASLEFDLIQVQGVFNITLALIAALVTWLLYVESPIYYLTMGDEQTAIECLRKLQQPQTVTTETYAMLESDRQYVAANDPISTSAGAHLGWPALLLLIYYRSVVAMSFSTATAYGILLSTTLANGGFPWIENVIVYGGVLVAGALIGVFMMDSLGRKWPTIIGTVICAVLAITIAVIFGSLSNWLIHGAMLANMILIIIYTLITGIYTVSSSVYLTEAFAMDIKPYYIAVTFIMQMLVQLIIIACGSVDISVFYYILGTFHVILAIFGVLLMPETKQTTLLGAQNMFNAMFWK